MVGRKFASICKNFLTACDLLGTHILRSLSKINRLESESSKNIYARYEISYSIIQLGKITDQKNITVENFIFYAIV